MRLDARNPAEVGIASRNCGSARQQTLIVYPSHLLWIFANFNHGRFLKKFLTLPRKAP